MIGNRNKHKVFYMINFNLAQSEKESQKHKQGGLCKESFLAQTCTLVGSVAGGAPPNMSRRDGSAAGAGGAAATAAGGAE